MESVASITTSGALACVTPPLCWTAPAAPGNPMNSSLSAGCSRNTCGSASVWPGGIPTSLAPAPTITSWTACAWNNKQGKLRRRWTRSMGRQPPVSPNTSQLSGPIAMSRARSSAGCSSNGSTSITPRPELGLAPGFRTGTPYRCSYRFWTGFFSTPYAVCVFLRPIHHAPFMLFLPFPRYQPSTINSFAALNHQLSAINSPNRFSYRFHTDSVALSREFALGGRSSPSRQTFRNS